MSLAEPETAPTFERTWQRPLTPLIGRDPQRDLIRALLLEDDTRLVTLLGPGGVGKTRLALSIAEELLTREGVEVVFVDLAPIQEPAQVLGRIAAALDLSEGDGEFTEAIIAEVLSQRAPLLMLDNMEQVISAAPVIAGLLAAAPGATFLATSRIPLRIRGEHQIVVPPLSLPERGSSAPLDAISASPAITLFVERARAVRSDFAVTDANSADLVEICRRIDGLPLAIELAAARSRLLSPSALLSRLDRLAVLGRGADDLPERQQTMRQAIAWSVDLLDPAERTILHRLSIFAGSFSPSAAEAVCGGDDGSADVLDHLTSLAEKSLVQIISGPDGEIRMRLLETVRAFARDEMQSADIETSRDRHAAFFGEFAATAEPEFMGSDQVLWFSRTDSEHDNLRAAIGWLIERQNAADAVRLAGNLWPFWYGKGILAEGRRWLETALAMPGDIEAQEKAKAWNGLGAICNAQGDDAGAVAACEVAVELWRSVGDRRSVGSVLNNLAILAEHSGRYEEALRLNREALAVFEELDDRFRVATVLANTAVIARVTGDPTLARSLDERALGIRRAINDTTGISVSLHNISILLRDAGDLTAAAAYQQEAADLFEELGDPRMTANALNSLGSIRSAMDDIAESDRHHQRALAIAREIGESPALTTALHNLGMNARLRGDLSGAMTFFRECLEVRRQLDAQITILTTLEGVARVAMDATNLTTAVTIFAYTRRVRDETTYAIDEANALSELRTMMPLREFSVAAETGRQASFETIVDFALAFDPTVSRTSPSARPTASAPKQTDHGLTARELDVLRLIATGRSNAEIGAALFISPLTAKTHVGNLLGKLSLETRAAAATWAAHQGIV